MTYGCGAMPLFSAMNAICPAVFSSGVRRSLSGFVSTEPDDPPAPKASAVANRLCRGKQMADDGGRQTPFKTENQKQKTFHPLTSTCPFPFLFAIAAFGFLDLIQ